MGLELYGRGVVIEIHADQSGAIEKGPVHKEDNLVLHKRCHCAGNHGSVKDFSQNGLQGLA